MRVKNFYKKIKNIRLKNWKVMFFITGIGSTLWFLIRVIPKPSRAAYPCMSTAAPIMSGFIVYILSLTGSAYALKRFGKKIITGKYRAAFSLAILALVFMVMALVTKNDSLKAGKLSSSVTMMPDEAFTPNEPVGIAKGLFPGRVVWVWDRDATDSTMSNTSGDYWFQNTNQQVVDTMLKTAITSYAGEESISAAWDAIIKHFNSNHGKGETVFTAGEKFYIKINLTNSCCNVSGTRQTSNFERMDATPEMVLAILKQLIEVVGADQSDIYIGDPFRTFRDNYWDLCHAVYPDVNYCDGKGLNGRHQTVPTTEEVFKSSDGLNTLRIPQEYVDADYFINMPCLKSHNSGGITIGAKNHQGSILQDDSGPEGQSAFVMHYSLPEGDEENNSHHRYRHLVDYLGHENIGGKTLITIVDAIWAGRNWEGQVDKWQMSPFNNDYPNSIFVSQDLVAIDAVGYDFLLEEYKNKAADIKFPYMGGTDDYLLQAADPANWAGGITYDPEGDGTPLGSLGVYEHWNNATDKQYTRNLGTGEGIELVLVVPERIPSQVSAVKEITSEKPELKCYPNPAEQFIFFEYRLIAPSHVIAEVYSMEGRKMATLKQTEEFTGAHSIEWNTGQLASGSYIMRLTIKTDKKSTVSTVKFQVR